MEFSITWILEDRNNVNRKQAIPEKTMSLNRMPETIKMDITDKT